MVIELYHDTNAVCCQKVELVLSEKSLAWSSHVVDLARGAQLDREYLKINPNGYLPALIHDGTPIIESTVICEFLDETYAQPPLRPADPAQRSRMRLWTKRVDEALHEAGSVLSFSAALGERFRKLPVEERYRRYRNVGDPIREDMYKSTVEEGFKSPYVTRAVTLFERAFSDLEETLSQGAKWIVGDRYTLADTSMAPYVARLDYLGILDVWLEHRPLALSWWDRVMARPSFKAAISAPIPEDEIEYMNTTGAKLKPFVKRARNALVQARGLT